MINIYITVFAKTFTDSNPRPVVHCMQGWGGGGVILTLISHSPNNGANIQQDDRDMTHNKITMYLFENILQY